MTLLRLDKTALTITTLDEADKADLAYWHKRSVEERLEMVERLRELNYGKDAVSGRLQRVLEITRRE